ncbi:hypothetical protein SDC9_206493 [bioreactor metagenome]|uniref:Uncharacterized protein n=1 Tax=bioreactor metagenome TaxID=1076179 RepID=A0A645J7V7_9ZZZZ
MPFLAVPAQAVVALAYHQEHSVARHARELVHQRPVRIHQRHAPHGGEAQLHGVYAQPVGPCLGIALGELLLDQA